MANRINYHKWVAVDQEYTMNVAKSQRAMDNLSTDLRLLLLAQARMNEAGHAHFDDPRGRDDSELRTLLGHLDSKTGEIIRASRQTIHTAKQKLHESGLLVDTSGGLRCVWVATEYAEKGGRNPTVCPFHGHRERGFATQVSSVA